MRSLTTQACQNSDCCDHLPAAFAAAPAAAAFAFLAASSSASFASSSSDGSFLRDSTALSRAIAQ